MQAGGRRGHRSRMIGKDRLVALAVGWLVLARNVGRQGNVAEALDRLGDVSLRCQADSPQPILAAADHFGGKFSVSEFDALSHADLPSRPDQRFPLLRSDFPGQENFDLRRQEFTCGAAIAARLFRANAFPAAE